MSQSIKKLINGNKEFKQKFYSQKNSVFNELVLHGQQPKTMIVSCSDSRVDPAMIFNAGPGELFVIRNVANLIPPCEENDTYHGTSSALEFGTNFLKVEQIIILGHSQCGGIQALFQHEEMFAKKPQSFIPKWIELARPAYEKVIKEHKDAPLEEKTTLCEHYALINSLSNVRSFPWIEEKIAANKLAIHAWYFDLSSGSLSAYNEDQQQWNKL